MRIDRNKAGIILCFLTIIIIFIMSYIPSHLSSLANDEIGIFCFEDEVYVQLPSGDCIMTTDIDGTKYAFIPTFCKAEKHKDIRGQQALLGSGDVSGTSEISYDEEQQLTITSGKDILFEGVIVFCHSANIYTTFIDLRGAEVTDLDREYYLDSDLQVVAPDGSVDCKTDKMYIRCRGNSSFGKKKKAYTIKLNKQTSIGKMSSSKKYYLLANAFDGSRLLNKLVFGMLEGAGMEYTTNAVWTDLYINGEYRGNYLLCESIDISPAKINTAELEKFNSQLYAVSDDDHYEDENGKGYYYADTHSDITGGYIVEKDLDDYYEGSKCGFVTASGTKFTVKYPNNASKEEIDYIRSVFQNIEDLISAGDENLFNYIDIDSFAKRYLIEELSLNSDAEITSYFFYKKADDPLIYAGPGWDYDGAFGEMKEGCRDYSESILDLDEIRGMDTLGWDKYLSENENYRERLKETYSKLRPALLSTYEKQIDTYADTIRASVAMDYERWPDLMDETTYADYNSTIRYVKYFFYHRMLFLDEMFGIESSDIAQPETTGEVHIVTLSGNGSTTNLEVPDGECIDPDSLPKLTDPDKCWIYKNKNEAVSSFVPVYEDMEIEAGYLTEE